LATKDHLCQRQISVFQYQSALSSFSRLNKNLDTSSTNNLQPSYINSHPSFMNTKCLSLAALTVALAGPACALDLDHPDFSDVSGLQLNGNASQAGNVLRLTPALQNQAGSAFSELPVNLNNSFSFSTRFSFRISDSGGLSDDNDGPGADGLVFVVQTVANNVGNAGGGMGFSGIPNSVGVEFDSWNNEVNGLDFDGNHVAVDLNGDISNSLGQTHVDPRLNDGDIWHAWVDYNGPSMQMEVRLSLNGARPVSPLIALPLDLGTVLGVPDAYVGFTAGTGGAWGNHDILQWQFESDYNPIGVPDAGSSFVLLAAACLGLRLCRGGNGRARCPNGPDESGTPDDGGTEMRPSLSKTSPHRMARLARPVLAAVALTSLAPAARAVSTVYHPHDVVTDTNPNGPWSYGWSQTRGSGFQPLTHLSYFEVVTRVWRVSAHVLPQYAYNSGAISGFHPGGSGENAILRWTAPADGQLDIDALFYTPTATVDPAVLLNNLELASGFVTPSISWTYQSSIPVKVGDLLDFSVGDGGNGFVNDSTALELTLTLHAASPVPDASVGLSFALFGVFACMAALRRQYPTTRAID